MPSTRAVLSAPLNRPIKEFPLACAVCRGPLHLTDHENPSTGRMNAVLVHARHRDWLAFPHAAEPELS
jgi:hypothetical protein